jgi:hypothetical protein
MCPLPASDTNVIDDLSASPGSSQPASQPASPQPIIDLVRVLVIKADITDDLQPLDIVVVVAVYLTSTSLLRS